MRYLFTFMTILLFANHVKATTQVSDVLHLGKDTLFFYNSPLEKIKDIGKRISELRKDEHVISSECWNGFRAEWKVIDDFLYLSNVFDCQSDKKLNSLIEEILGTKFIDGLIKANFVSGDYWAGKDQVHEFSIYIPIYKQEIKFTINEGRVGNSSKIESIPCEYSEEGDLKNFILKNLNHNEMNDLNGEIIEISGYIKSDKTGKIRVVKIEHSTHPETNNLFKDAIMKLPCRPVYFNKGEYWSIEESVYLSIKMKELKEIVR